MPVDVSDTTASHAAAGVEAAAERLLELLHCDECELSVLLTGDPGIQKLNRQWRGKDVPTDVLSFSQLEGPGNARGSARAKALRRLAAGEHLGDVVISVETARRQAAEGGWTLEEEMNRLLVHGVLHLLGYDHERGGADQARMKAEEARLASALIAQGLPCAQEQRE